MRGRQRRPLLPRYRPRLWPHLHMFGPGWRGCVPCRGGLPSAPPPSLRAQGLGIHGWQGESYNPTMRMRKLRLRESRDSPSGSQPPSRGLGHREDTRWDPRFGVQPQASRAGRVVGGGEERTVGEPAGNLATHPMMPHPFLPWQLWWGN